MKRTTFVFLMVWLVAGLTLGCSSASAGKIPLTFVEYNRGLSTSGSSDVTIASFHSSELRYHDVKLEGLPLFPDGSIIPNAFFKPLFHGDFHGALNAFTEPYYGIRIYHFFAGHPHWGAGLDFIHLKVFMADPDQKVSVTCCPSVGADGQVRLLAELVRLGDWFDTLNVSHGVNHVSFNAAYRWMFRPSANAPEGRFQPFVDAGGGPAVPHLELTTREGARLSKKAYSYNWRLGNWALGAGAGLRWKIKKRFGTYAEYKWTYSILNNMHYDNADEATVRMKFSSSHVAWGVSFGF